MSEGRLHAPRSHLYAPRPRRLLQTLAAKLRSPGISVGIVSHLAKERDLGRVRRVRNAPSGWRNSTVVARSDATSLVVKRYRDGTTVDAVVWEHSILERLERDQIAATRLLRTAAGDTYSIVEGAIHAAFRFERGRSLAGCYLSARTRAHAVSEAAAALSAMHQSLAGVLPEGSHPLGFATPEGPRRRDLKWYVSQAVALAQLPAPPADASHDHAWLAGHASRLVDELGEFDARLETADLPRTIVHGDYGLHNLIFRPGGAPVIHDLELARIEWRLTDIVDVLARLDPGSGATFMRAYRQHSRLTDDELTLMESVWRHHRLCGAVRSWATFHQRGGERRLDTARRRAEAAFSITTPVLRALR